MLLPKNLYNFTLSILLFAFVSGCVPKPIEIDVQPAPQKMVVASQIIPGQLILVALTKSFSPLISSSNTESISQTDVEKYSVKNALVTVSHNGITDTLQMVYPGLYSNMNIVLQDYAVYSLHARDPFTGEEISATTTLLPQVKFDTIFPVITKSRTDTTISIQYELSDNQHEQNYYVLSYPSKKASKDILNQFEKESKKGITKNYSDFELLSDIDFTNGKLKKKIKLGINPTDTFSIQIAHINKDYYDFLSTYKRSGSFINTISGEPVNYPTNVLNGYGYFNAHYPDARVFFMEDYLNEAKD